MGELLHIIQRGARGLGGQRPRPASPLLAVPNVTAHPSTASVPTTYGIIRCGTIIGHQIFTAENFSRLMLGIQYNVVHGLRARFRNVERH